MSSDSRNPLVGLGPPTEPEGLRAAVLSAARNALVDAPEPDFWWRVWTSRTFRLAWVGGVAALLAAHLLLPLHRTGHPVGYSMPVAVAAASENGELAEITDLPRITRDLPSLVGRAVGPRQPEETPS